MWGRVRRLWYVCTSLSVVEMWIGFIVGVGTGLEREGVLSCDLCTDEMLYGAHRQL